MSIIILDTETTGKNDPVACEIAFLEIAEDFSIIRKYCERFNPGKPIELGATAIHHIFEKDILDKPTITSFNLINEVPELKYIIGHNVDYDWQVLGKPHIYRICTLAIARFLLPDIDSHTQTALIYYFKGRKARELVKSAHSAAIDVEICHSNLLNLLYEAEQQGYDVTTIHKIWEFSELSRIPLKMTFGKHKGELIKNVPYDYVKWLLKQPDLDPYLYEALINR